MRLAVMVFLSLAFPLFASAAKLTYRIDASKTPDLREVIESGMCGDIAEITIDSKEDLSTAVIRKVFGPIESSKVIQATSGEYRVRVALVNTGDSLAYKGGVVYRVETTTYGSTQAPRAFTLDMELLNYRESAELAEGMACSSLVYRLISVRN